MENSNLDIPSEFGITAYLQKNFNSFFSNIYGGLDYEDFSTFNLQEILAGTSIQLTVKSNQILFLTAGLGLKFSIFSPINIKFSMSKGVYAGGDFNGTKYLFYFNQKIGKKFWYHILYKQHALESSLSELSIGRIGIGVGMSLF